MITDTKPLAERLRRWRSRAEDGAGTLPAKDSVKVRSEDWHAVCDGLSHAADALDAKDALLREAAEALRPNIAHTSIRALVSRIEAALLLKWTVQKNFPAPVEKWNGYSVEPLYSHAYVATLQAQITGLREALTAADYVIDRLDASARGARVRDMDEARERYRISRLSEPPPSNSGDTP